MDIEKKRDLDPGTIWIPQRVAKRRFWHRWPSLGWAGKTLWDWQALLFFPLAIAFIATMITDCQGDRQRDLQNLGAERTVVAAYFETMGTLLLKEDLRTKGGNSTVGLVARARTLAALDGVNGYRKVRLLEFLSETKLIQHPSEDEPPVISLRFADLRNAPLVRRHILSGVDLRKAQLDGANMDSAALIDTDLSGADLSGADLTEADLSDVQGGITCQETSDAKSLEKATMPDGQTYEDWLREKGGCKE